MSSEMTHSSCGQVTWYGLHIGPPTEKENSPNLVEDRGTCAYHILD